MHHRCYNYPRIFLGKSSRKYIRDHGHVGTNDGIISRDTLSLHDIYTYTHTRAYDGPNRNYDGVFDASITGEYFRVSLTSHEKKVTTFFRVNKCFIRSNGGFQVHKQLRIIFGKQITCNIKDLKLLLQLSTVEQFLHVGTTSQAFSFYEHSGYRSSAGHVAQYALNVIAVLSLV